MDELLKSVSRGQIKTDVPDFRTGDTVRIHYQVIEGDKVRVQIFEGTVIARRGGGIDETFMVRKISGGVGVERVFPLNSPRIAKIEITRHGKVRRSKLFYLRKKTGRAARIKERRVFKK
ncbi:MAG: 50S ribosomal protein L19 [Candidatus Fermentibacteraceae bacterium]|nr:50S ribosomal protein L19 [Candidatus Fermentibacteraceae bacterium]